MSLTPLDALSPVDGRYARAADLLRGSLSESALIRERVRIEARWLLWLTDPAGGVFAVSRPLPAAVRTAALQLASEPDADCAANVKRIEASTNHDVKAVEYYVREFLAAAGADKATLELVHFGCTSEDINNLAYATLLRQARRDLGAVLASLVAALEFEAARHADRPMLARTHGQPASPTTLGKEFANVVARLKRGLARWNAVATLGKWGGAVGNFNAHVVALPKADWPQIASRFVASQDLEWNPHTTQIEPHDWIAEYCDALAGINVVLVDLSRDIWGYISLGYLKQRAVPGEVGSSTMPHKVNPIDFENAEGNLGIANALLRHFAEKLPVSRWQRDLTDSTVLRNLGVALAHALIAWRALLRGLAKLDANPTALAADLDAAWEVLGEAVQTVLRAQGVPDGYERLKDLTRGRALDGAAYRALVDSLPLPAAQRSVLAALTPADYVGLAAELARRR